MHFLRRATPALILTLAGILAAARWVPVEQADVQDTLASFPDADPFTHHLRPLILALLCLIPAIGGWLYAFSGTLARYVTRQFLTLLGICLGGLVIIWLLMDFQDNVDDIKASGSIAATTLALYRARLPEILITLVPYALLLSLLLCLGRLSGSREIIAMVQTGRGLARITLPFITAGLLATAFCIGLNFHWAPRSTANEKQVIDSARGRDATAAEMVLFRNPRSPRLWMVRSFPADWKNGAPLQGIRVISEDGQGRLSRILVASSATHDRISGHWSFQDAAIRRIKPGEAPRFVRDLPDPYVVTSWRETPAEIIQPGLPPDQLGIPDLTGWLHDHGRDSKGKAAHLTQWHHRFSQPLNCLVVVLLATPLGIYFSRRGTTGGVAIAVFLAMGLLFLTTICLSLGDSSHLPPLVAAWLPNAFFGILALYLFRRRLAGRPIYQTLRRLIPNES
ncbi:MAG: LptF/LptG family permease [Akkermansiaceae bacterium]|jgi:lipopolysaccharide export system permease protein|nr:LptF/LptG family permease [Akkermansiaceae bacterium]